MRVNLSLTRDESLDLQEALDRYTDGDGMPCDENPKTADQLMVILRRLQDRHTHALLRDVERRLA